MKFQLPLVTICRQRHDRAGVSNKGNSYHTGPRALSALGALKAGERDAVD
jgi:hypothetical protein